MKKIRMLAALAALVCVGAVRSFAADAPSVALLSPMQMFLSSQTATADTTKALFAGRGCVWKVIVSSAGSSSTIQLYDGNGTSTGLDLGKLATTTRGEEWEFAVPVSSGLTYTTANTATVSILYTTPDIPTWCVNRSSHTATADTTKAIFANRGKLSRVLMNNGTGNANILFYDGNGTSTGRKLVNPDGAGKVEADYNIFVSSGLTYTTSGTADWIILYQQNPR